MGISERQCRIIALLGNQDYVTVEELSRDLQVSKVTVRSDLADMENRGLIFRTHGGAMIAEHKASSRRVENTLNELESEKKGIAKAAASLLRNDQTVIIDCGSTTVNLAGFLKGKHITLVTNSLLAIEAVKDDDSVEVVSIGGNFRRFSMGFLGPLATSAFSQIHADFLFLGATGYTEEQISCSNLIEAEVKQTMLRVADVVCFMADSSKFGKKSFATVASWNDIDVFVTDRINPVFRKKLEDKGIEVILADLD